MKFTQSEVKQIPSIALQKVISSRFANETIAVKARGLDGTGIVKGFVNQEYVIVTDKDQKEVKIKISDITEIQRIWKSTVPADSSNKNGATTADTVGETLIYAPLIPVAIGTAPFLRMTGLDALKNNEDEEKARLVYEGMSKQNLIQAIGEPMEKYHCNPKNANGSIDIWVYGKQQVLRGGRSLFIDSDKGTVYHNSYDTTFFKNSEWLNCSQVENNTTTDQEK
ncbi:hypothetical protein [Sulfurimonas sp. HSL3-2]|uniref:hypothetical protein n=1 Tax=Hydrocurvibacter mobilis TaxID=3131936 RepID=UPI0031F7DC77